MQIEITLEQLVKFLDKFGVDNGGIRTRAMTKVIPVLEQTLQNKVFRVPHSDTSKIQNIKELQTLIARSGKGSHKPASAIPGAPYSKEYLLRKASYGEYYPHKFWNYGFYHGIEFYQRGISVVMKADPIYERGFDYMSHHERRRSVLKRTFLLAWQDIIDVLIKHYAEEARG